MQRHGRRPWCSEKRSGRMGPGGRKPWEDAARVWWPWQGGQQAEAPPWADRGGGGCRGGGRGPSEGTQRGCGDAASRAHGPAAGPADGLAGPEVSVPRCGRQHVRPRHEGRENIPVRAVVLRALLAFNLNFIHPQRLGRPACQQHALGLGLQGGRGPGPCLVLLLLLLRGELLRWLLRVACEPRGAAPDVQGAPDLRLQPHLPAWASSLGPGLSLKSQQMAAWEEPVSLAPFAFSSPWGSWLPDPRPRVACPRGCVLTGKGGSGHPRTTRPQ